MGRLGIALLLLLASGFAQEGAPAPDKQEPPVVLAVLVHPDNPVTDLPLSELRAMFKLERQFWASKERCSVYLPPSKSDEYAVLLDKVYRMKNKKLQKYWVQKLFSGEIPSKPEHVPNAKSAIEKVKAEEGAITVIAFAKGEELPKGVKLLTVDGKRPDAADYPLLGKPSRDDDES
ncbi:MAG: hypothetical protein HC813_03685 [Planctomycetes bacterium]|nr:hypothetical protein [Planctomycetota bacterium]